ncbi:efflux RND transporter permease subunit [Bradyrhizobium sp. AUGA SZCCT0176]|nr:efflux RND transporter permease subunit [Bradyrhizobium sp. AUGA SZCCT0176]
MRKVRLVSPPVVVLNRSFSLTSFQIWISAMAEFDPATVRKRTAILVVHGIGSQRALETVRGVIRGVWLDEKNPADKGKRIWTHPERDGSDIDLAVMTTNRVPDSPDGRLVDFHELYWAHLMSETKAVAVLLWLYELVRKGPIMKLGMNGLWWAAAIFLCLMNLSFAVLVLQGIFLFSQNSAQIMVVAPYLLLFASLVLGFAVAKSWGERASRLARPLAISLALGLVPIAVYVVVGICFPGGEGKPDGAEFLTQIGLPTLIAFLATLLIMGKQGKRAFGRALIISLMMSIIFIAADRLWHWDAPFTSTLIRSWVWGLNSPWSVAAASAVIGLYLIINAAFLQPYLGDAARYFRNSPANVAVRRAIRKEAVDRLANLHASGQYDRIVVVAHSLGTVVAYDMLRAYFSRVCNELPPVEELGTDFDAIDSAAWQPEDAKATIEDKKALRIKARATIASIAAAAAKPMPQQHKPKSWLVTDFVTLGSALTHAYFLMCLGKTAADLKAEGRLNTEQDLKDDFARRVGEREFPTCPPKRLDRDGLLTFTNPKTHRKQIHNGALFGLTRWSNIYFPRRQLFWGDAIGGALSPIFGYHIVDLAVSTRKAGGDDFFTHTAYWDVRRAPDTCQAPHIVTLRKAIDLADTGAAIDLVDEGDDPSAHDGN